MPKKHTQPGMVYFDRWIPAPTAHIRHIGVWDMQDLYEVIADWFRLKKYKFNELYQEHRPYSPFGAEVIYILEANRNENDYTQIRYDIYLHTFDEHKFEVIIPNNEKKLFSKGRIWIEIRVVVLYDFEKRWDEKAFYRYIKDFYNKYIIKKKSEYEYSPKFRTEMFELHAMMKERLKFESEEFEHAHLGGVHVRT